MPLTDEDKNWMRAELTNVTGEIRQSTAIAIDASEVKVRAELKEIPQSTAIAIEASEANVRAELKEIRQSTAIAIEATETKLLTAFHEWASPMHARIRSHSAALRALDLESEALSDRVAKLEPPH